MLNIADFLVACFVFLLFVSIYRKRSTTEVRCWVVGWMCIVVHFGALMSRPTTQVSSTVRDVVALGTLVLCGTAFALSQPGPGVGKRRRLLRGTLLGLPWLAVMLLGCLPGPGWYKWVLAAAWVSEVSVVEASMLLFRGRPLRVAAVLALVLGCGLWLGLTARGGDAGMIQCVVLTQCFGLNAVLLAGRPPRMTVANLTLTIGAVAWASVWASAVLVERFLPGLHISPEIWNLPKYFVASGMVLRLLDEEIRSTEMASEQYRLMFASNPQPMWMYDADTLAFLEVNDAAVAQYGFSHTDFAQMALPEVVQFGEGLLPAAELRSSEPQVLAGPWLHRRKDGSQFQVDVASQPVRRDGRAATFALMHDVTESQRLHAQLIRQAHYDALTGLPNRAYFEEALETAVQRAGASAQKAAVFCIDLDRFKQINDTFGHGAGDRCLREVAARMSACLGPEAMLARTGGDEFMLVVGALEEAKAAGELATRLLTSLRTPVSVDGAEVELMVSIGVALCPEDGNSPAQMWRDADAAMYRAKRAGGGQWVRVSEEISSEANQANEVEISLRRALKTGELALFYQPQMLVSGTLHSMEALVRFRDPILARAAADRVIAIAEESGLIVPLGEWVLEEVCRQSREWMDAGYRPVPIALNVSPLQLIRSNLSLKVASLLETYRLCPRMLEFEVTESTVMPDRSEAPQQIATLAQMGIPFSVDDFGTGYSSLGRLHQLPVAALKIDCSFTRRLAERKGTYPTVRAIIALAHTLGMKVVAEGVETEEQLTILCDLECDRVQGYLFSKPIPAVEARSFLMREDDGLPSFLPPEESHSARTTDAFGGPSLFSPGL